MGWVPLSLAIATLLVVSAQAQVPVLLNGTSTAALQTSNGQLITISVAGVFLATSHEPADFRVVWQRAMGEPCDGA